MPAKKGGNKGIASARKQQKRAEADARNAQTPLERTRDYRRKAEAGEVMYVARLTECTCGHAAVEHYDSHDFCTWSTTDPPQCTCTKFEPAETERYVQVSDTKEEKP